MRHGDHDVTGHHDVGSSANGPGFRCAVLGRRHHAQIEDVQNGDDGEVHLPIGRIAVKAVVDDGDVGPGDEDRDSAVVQGLDDVLHDEAHTVETVIDCASAKTAVRAHQEQKNGPPRNGRFRHVDR